MKLNLKKQLISISIRQKVSWIKQVRKSGYKDSNIILFHEVRLQLKIKRGRVTCPNLCFNYYYFLLNPDICNQSFISNRCLLLIKPAICSDQVSSRLPCVRS